MQQTPDNGIPGSHRRDKVYSSPAAALADISQGAVVFISGFAGVGWPESLLQALLSVGADSLTVVCQGARTDTNAGGKASNGLEQLIASGRVSRLISPIPFFPGKGGAVEEKWARRRPGAGGGPPRHVGGAHQGRRSGTGGRVPSRRLRHQVCPRQRGQEHRGAGTMCWSRRCGPISPCCGPAASRHPGQHGLPGYPAQLEPNDGHGRRRHRSRSG